MNKVGLWNVTGRFPVRLAESEIQLESLLEKWIELDPGLIREGLCRSPHWRRFQRS